MEPELQDLLGISVKAETMAILKEVAQERLRAEIKKELEKLTPQQMLEALRENEGEDTELKGLASKIMEKFNE